MSPTMWLLFSTDLDPMSVLSGENFSKWWHIAQVCLAETKNIATNTSFKVVIRGWAKGKKLQSCQKLKGA